MKPMRIHTGRRLGLVAVSVLGVWATVNSAQMARADVVSDWNMVMENALRTAGVTPPGQARPPAMVHAAIFDAVNGIVQKYEPYFVREEAPEGARPEAAAAAAAYTVLLSLYPDQKATFDAALDASLAAIPGSRGRSRSIARGVTWGAYVANRILEWRAQDGFSTPTPNYFGGTGPGVWRSIGIPGFPDGTLPAVFPQMATLVPFAMPRHDSFRPGPPPALLSPQYAADVNEIKLIGAHDSTVRTAEQTQIALLWQAMGLIENNRIVRQVVPKNNRLVDNARLFALANMVMADAAIAGFDSKYTYNFWRPHHAIRLADSAGNSAVVQDPNWTALITAPRHQEYISNHAVITGGMLHALAQLLGDEHTFTISAPGYPSFTWTFDRFSDAAVQVKMARMWAGIHYRNSVDVGERVGNAIAEYIVGNSLRPLHDEHRGGAERD